MRAAQVMLPAAIAKFTHTIAYADALRGLHQRFPEDDEVTTLLAVALLGNGYRDREGVVPARCRRSSFEFRPHPVAFHRCP